MVHLSEPMLVTATNSGPVLTTTGVFVIISAGIMLLWLIILSMVVIRRLRRPWHDDGTPVYQRLPDGRVRFSWGVACDLAAVQRTSGVTDPGSRRLSPSTAPILTEGEAHARR